ncbi:MAG: YhcH/YjgK/YiaL family protein [Bacteroidota bacterium]
MIVDTLDNAARYYMLHPALEMVLDYLESLTPDDFSEGKIEISGDDVFINAMYQSTKAEDEAAWEAHETYIDIHYLVEGTERIFYAEEDKMEVDEPYNAEKDCTLYKGNNGFEVNLPEGGFVIFLPGEIHKAMVADGPPVKVKKLVGKIRVD